MSDANDRLHDREAVRREYSSDAGLATRAVAFQSHRVGPDARDVAFDLVARVPRTRVLEVGPGRGEFTQRVRDSLGCTVVGVDIARVMVDHTRARGIDAVVADVRDLPWRDETFDCVIANWVLYHVDDIDRALAECVRILRRGGDLVAATTSDHNLAELWESLGEAATPGRRFTRENGAAALARHFDSTEQHDVEAEVVFPDAGAVRAYVAASITKSHLAERVTDFAGEFRARSAQSVFVAHRSS
jgi:ubiquinone/menaquinone biosynthesis C-methylase UbiE